MKIGIVGLGKLGLPVALAIESKGHEVIGYEISEQVINSIWNNTPTDEAGVNELLEKSKLTVTEAIQDLAPCDIIFVAVQTPHDPKYEGVTRLPKERKDFDYTYLENACKSLPESDALIVVISTVLPGTMESRILPILKGNEVVYNPFFIAMGTVIEDFLNPEFVLIGTEIGGYIKSNALSDFYNSIHELNPQFWCSIREAEMIKVSYNTFITSKIAIANTIGEMCHKLHINSDVVIDALKMGTDRIISTKYLSPGMGDGGGCHPRDNIALSWLSQKVNLSYDWYENLMTQREKHTEFLAQVIIDEHLKNPHLPIVILGKAFKANIKMTDGSPSILLGNILKEKGIEFEYSEVELPDASIYFVGCNHNYIKEFYINPDSIVIDPWGIIQEGDFKLIKIGRTTS